MDEDRPCYVEYDGEWYEGFVLRWWKGQDDRWRGYVEWTVRPGETHRASVTAERLRPRGFGPEALGGVTLN